MSVQQVNLLQADLVPARNWLDSRQMIFGASALALFLVAYSGLQALRIPQLQDIEKTATNQLQIMRQAPEITSVSDEVLIADIKRLRSEEAEHRQLMNMIGHKQGAQYSSYLIGLADAQVAGLWLDKIDLEQGMRQTLIGLHGQCVDAGRVPKLLQALTLEGPFMGHRFSDISIESTGAVLNFSVTTQGENKS